HEQRLADAIPAIETPATAVQAKLGILVGKNLRLRGPEPMRGLKAMRRVGGSQLARLHHEREQPCGQTQQKKGIAQPLCDARNHRERPTFLLAAFYVLDRIKTTCVERLDLPIIGFKSDAVPTTAGPYCQIVALGARIGVRFDFEPCAVHLPSTLFRIADLNPFHSRDTSAIHVYPYQATVLNHERDVSMLGRIHVEASLVFLIVRLRKLFVEN